MLSYETTTPFHYQRFHSIADRCMWSYNISIRPKALDDSSNPLLENYIWSFEYVLGYGYGNYRAVSVKPDHFCIEIKNREFIIPKFCFYGKKQKFSSTSFPHVFKAIGPLESNLETKNHFLSPSKK